MHFGFNNKFIKAMRTRPILKKNPPKYCFLLVYGIMNFYIKYIFDIKKVVLLYRH